MTSPRRALLDVARSRSRDPFAPVTVMAPSHVAAIHLRRRLAESGDFAGVRFETLPRLAELLGAADLARAGRRPLARPIGDYLTLKVAEQASGELAGVRDLPGFARVLRDAFRRLRRGGFASAEQVPVPLDAGTLGEVARLYALFRRHSSAFYDEEDLLDSAATSVGRHPGGSASDLGQVFVVRPAGLSAAADHFLAALRRAAAPGGFHVIDGEPPDSAALSHSEFVLAPDPASEAREAVREVLRALEQGCPLHEVALIYGDDPAYRSLLNHALEQAGIPAAPMPGTPLSELTAGRAVLCLAELPLKDYSHTAAFDFLSLAPLRAWLPTEQGSARSSPGAWLREAREAGVTSTLARWETGLATVVADRRADLARDDLAEETRAVVMARLEHAETLRAFISRLIGRLEPLRAEQPAGRFISAFKHVISEYLDTEAPGMEAVLGQIDQLGTIDALGASFGLGSFTAALRANLDAVAARERGLGRGVLVADYRLAAGLDFRHVVLCGAHEGAFPAPPPVESLVDDATWSYLRGRGHTHVEDAALRSERSHAAAGRAVMAATERLVWTAPLRAAGATKELYPSQLMLAAARARSAEIHSATQLKRAPASAWLRRPPSTLAAMLSRPVLDKAELRTQASLALAQRGEAHGENHPLAPALQLLRARRGPRFSEYDGNLSQLSGDALVPRNVVTPTSLEHYATCGMRYFLQSVIRLRPREEPEDRDTIDSRDRGTMVHQVLSRFFREALAQGRPLPFEDWTADDRDRLLAILEEEALAWERRGRLGLPVFAAHELRRLRADLGRFLEEDNLFRASTGAVPAAFEQPVLDRSLDGLQLSGIADRVDLTPDGRQAWVIDYKTGKADSFAITDEDPLAAGTKLQLPAYLAAAENADTVNAFYWFITSAGEFQRKAFPISAATLERYRQTLHAVLNGIRSGSFPAVPGSEDRGSFVNCRYCDFNRLCSRRRDDELIAKQEDRQLAAWTRVGETARGSS